MGELRDRMDADLRLGGYSPKTRECYLERAKAFAKHFMRSPAEMGEAEIRAFLLYLVDDREVSYSTYNQTRGALKFLYTVTLRRPIEIAHVPVPRRKVTLPVVLSQNEVQNFLCAFRRPKYVAMAMTLYAGGLRISEACRLRPEDIDSERMVIRLRSPKGNRDRYTVLSVVLLEFLRHYWRTERPRGGWLFPGANHARHLSPDAVEKAFRKAVATAGIKKRVTPHVLRHSFATHLVEGGVDISVVKALLGHRSVQTTQVYTHVSLEHLGGVRSPLDRLVKLKRPRRPRRR